MEIIVDEDLRAEFNIEIKCEVIKDRYGLTYDSDKGHCGSILKVNKDDIRLIHWEKYLMQVEWVRNYVKTKYILLTKEKWSKIKW